jgi:hypothetical protein
LAANKPQGVTQYPRIFFTIMLCKDFQLTQLEQINHLSIEMMVPKNDFKSGVFYIAQEMSL